MTSIPDSQIFISPSDTTAFAADAWPLREDVFAPDANLSGETATAVVEFARDTALVGEAYTTAELDAEYPEETYAGESYPLGRAERDYPGETYPGETDLFVEPESLGETYELEAGADSASRVEDVYASPRAEEWDPGGGASQEWMPVEEMSLDEARDAEADLTEPGYAEAGVGVTGVEEWAGVEVSEDQDAADVELAESGGEAGEAFPSGLVLTVASGLDGPDQQYWDPNSTGLPLYDTGAAVRPRKLSANFTVAELVRSGGRFDDRARISVALVQCLQAIRDRAGRPVTVTSGFRSWQRNVEVYRQADKKPTRSRHCSGQAADIKIAGMTGMQIAKLAVDACGERIGVGIGADFAHIDVRGQWAVWTYFIGARDSAAKAEIEDHRRHRGAPQPKPQPRPTPTPTGTVRAGRLVVERLPLLQSHAGTQPDLVLKWNAMVQPGAVDVVVHLHGYAGAGAAMDIVKHKEPISGLDFADPDNRSSVGRTTPTLLVLPRGNHQPHGRYGDNPERYTFPALVKPGALQQLVDDALARFASATGARVRRNRLILTAHSGGGAALMAILAHTDPDEVHTFDAQYENPAHLITWAQRRKTAGTGALRVLYRPHAKKAARSPAWANARNSERIAGAVGAAGSPNFRVEQTTVEHNHIPRKFGWRLLADSSADLPGVMPAAESELEADEEAVATDATAFDTEFDEPGFADQEGEGEFWGDTEVWEEGPLLADELDSAEADEDEAGELGETATEGEEEVDQLGGPEAEGEPWSAPEFEDQGEDEEEEEAPGDLGSLEALGDVAEFGSETAHLVLDALVQMPHDEHADAVEPADGFAGDEELSEFAYGEEIEDQSRRYLDGHDATPEEHTSFPAEEPEVDEFEQAVVAQRVVAERRDPATLASLHDPDNGAAITLKKWLRPAKQDAYHITGGKYTPAQIEFESKHPNGLILTAPNPGRLERRLTAHSPYPLGVGKEWTDFGSGRMEKFIADYNAFGEYFGEVLRAIGRLQDLLSAGAPLHPIGMTARQKQALKPTTDDPELADTKNLYRQWRVAREEYVSAESGVFKGLVPAVIVAAENVEQARHDYWKAAEELRHTIQAGKRLGKNKPTFDKLDLSLEDLTDLITPYALAVITAKAVDKVADAVEKRKQYDQKLKEFAELVAVSNEEVKTKFRTLRGAQQKYWAQRLESAQIVQKRDKARMTSTEIAALLGQKLGKKLAPSGTKRNQVLAEIRMPILVADAWHPLAVIGPQARTKLVNALKHSTIIEEASQKDSRWRLDGWERYEITRIRRAWVGAKSWEPVLTSDVVEGWTGINKLWDGFFVKFYR